MTGNPRSRLFLLLGAAAVTIGLLFFSVSNVVNGIVIYVPYPLEKIFLEAELVAHVRVAKITPVTYIEQSQKVDCGINYFSTVLKTYKGESRPMLSFAAIKSPLAISYIELREGNELREGDELVVLLRRRMPTEEPYIRVLPEKKLPAPSKERLACQARLSRYAPISDFESAFLLETRKDESGGGAAIWLVYGLRTDLPASVKAEDTKLYTNACIYVSGECLKAAARLVRWDVIEQQMLKWARESAGVDKSRK